MPAHHLLAPPHSSAERGARSARRGAHFDGLVLLLLVGEGDARGVVLLRAAVRPHRVRASRAAVRERGGGGLQEQIESVWGACLVEKGDVGLAERVDGKLEADDDDEEKREDEHVDARAEVEHRELVERVGALEEEDMRRVRQHRHLAHPTRSRELPAASRGRTVLRHGAAGTRGALRGRGTSMKWKMTSPCLFLNPE